MATFGTQTGFWVDWTKGQVLGSSITLTARSSNIVIAIASLWVGNLLAGWVWATVATIMYHQRSKSKIRDGIHVQHQLIWRNSGDPLTAALEILDVYLHRSKGMKRLKGKLSNLRRWSPRKGASSSAATKAGVVLPPAPSSSPKFDRIHRRSFSAFSTPFAIWAAFFIAGVFVSYIATPNHDVLAQSSMGLCGIWNISAANRPNRNQALAQGEVQNAYAIKVLNDTLNGRNYARSCYANDLGNLNPVPCSIYTKPTLSSFAVEEARYCPFRYHPSESFEGSVCDVPLSNGAFAMRTERLDSSNDLGINARRGDAIGFEKRVNCSVISLQNRTGTSTSLGFDTQSNVTWTTYLFGGFQSYVGDNVTYFTNIAASQSNNYGYQVKAVYSYAGVPEQNWIPAAPFDVADGDVSLFFFASNSVCYAERVYDPFFWATDPYDIAAGLSKPLRCYVPINPVAVMGCVDQYSICDSSGPHALCTEPGGIASLGSKVDGLHLNLRQVVTATRIVALFQNSDTFSSVYGTGTSALKASDKVLDVLSSGLPPDQWKIEVLGWFQTSLAKMQASAVEFVKNTADLGPFGNVSFPGSNDSTLPIWQGQCRSQRIANSGQYQVFSFFGIMILIWLGVFAYGIKKVSQYLVDKAGSPGDVYLADDKFQLQRMVLDVPVLNPGDEFPVYDPSHTNIRLPTPTSDGSVTYLRQHTTTGHIQISASAPTPVQGSSPINQPSAQATASQTANAAPQPSTNIPQSPPPQASLPVPQSLPSQTIAPNPPVPASSTQLATSQLVSSQSPPTQP